MPSPRCGRTVLYSVIQAPDRDPDPGRCVQLPAVQELTAHRAVEPFDVGGPDRGCDVGPDAFAGTNEPTPNRVNSSTTFRIRKLTPLLLRKDMKS